MIENGTAVAGDIQIGIAIIVEVADSNALAVVAFTAHAGFFRDVGESSVAVVVIKRAAQRMRRLVDVGCGRLDEVQIHEAVLIVVDPSDTGSHGFEVILFVGLRGVLLESDLRAFADIGVADGNGPTSGVFGDCAARTLGRTAALSRDSDHQNDEGSRFVDASGLISLLQVQSMNRNLNTVRNARDRSQTAVCNQQRQLKQLLAGGHRNGLARRRKDSREPWTKFLRCGQHRDHRRCFL